MELKNIMASFAATAAMGAAFHANATTYYLSSSGNDANDGTSEATAFKTVNKAFSAVHSHPSKDELVILPGEYAASGLLSLAGESTSNLADADVVRSSTRNPAGAAAPWPRTRTVGNSARARTPEIVLE